MRNTQALTGSQERTTQDKMRRPPAATARDAQAPPGSLPEHRRLAKAPEEAPARGPAACPATRRWSSCWPATRSL